MQTFEIRWFRDINGNYLSMKDSDKTIKIQALDLASAIETAKEIELGDSSIPFLERVSVSVA